MMIVDVIFPILGFLMIIVEIVVMIMTDCVLSEELLIVVIILSQNSFHFANFPSPPASEGFLISGKLLLRTSVVSMAGGYGTGIYHIGLEKDKRE